jgi:3-hydroxybutyryl-CoA dehydrogenase
VIEAIYENLDAKREIVRQRDDIVSMDTLWHTNTATLSVSAIASASRRPQRVVGTHYRNPAPLMKLVEMADGGHTSSPAYAQSRKFLESLGKTVVVTKDRLFKC